MSFGDIFYNETAGFIIIFIVFFVVFFDLLMRTHFGKRRENKGIIIIISFIIALLAVYGLYTKDLLNFNFSLFDFSNLFAFVASFVEFMKSLDFISAILSILIIIIFAR